MNNSKSNSKYEKEVDEDDAKWNIVADYIQNENGLVKHQLDSYNEYVHAGLEAIFEESCLLLKKEHSFAHSKNNMKQNEVQVKQARLVYKKIVFDDVRVSAPFIIEDVHLKLVSPDECRKRDLTYKSEVSVNITETTYSYDGETPNGELEPAIKSVLTREYKKVPLFSIPTMIGSSVCSTKLSDEYAQLECKLDKGGYFIVKGKERVLISQIRQNYNTPIVSVSKLPKYPYCCEMRSMSDDTGHSVLIKCFTTENNDIVVSLPYAKEYIPALVFFRAYGCSNADIVNIVRPETAQQVECVQKIIEMYPDIETRDDAIVHISKSCGMSPKKVLEYAADIVDIEMFPHMGITATRLEKAHMLGFIVKALLDVAFGLRKTDSKDDYINKRVESAGVLMHDLTRALFKRFVVSVAQKLEKKKSIPDLVSTLQKNACSITSGIKYSFLTGNWGIPKGGGYVKVGVSQVLSRLSYHSFVSHLRRSTIQIGKEGKNSEIRRIHPSQFLVVCPCECLDPNTPVRIFGENTRIRAADVKVGDVLVNDIGLPTRVLSTCSGNAPMYEIAQSYATNYTVTSNHILTLYMSERLCPKELEFNSSHKTLSFFDKISMCLVKKVFSSADADAFVQSFDPVVDISVSDYLNLPLDIQTSLFGFRVFTDQSPRKEGLGLIPNPRAHNEIFATPIHARASGIGPFCGFQLDGTQRFQLGDYTVTHNSPEGMSIGIVLNFATIVNTTTKVQTVLVREIIERSPYMSAFSSSDDIPIEGTNSYLEYSCKYAFVMLNGIPIGRTRVPTFLVDDLKAKRDIGLLPMQVSITYTKSSGAVYIYCDFGRLVRPVIPMKKLRETGKSASELFREAGSWNAAVSSGLLQWLDVNELQNEVCTFNESHVSDSTYSFLEIDPSLMHGTIAATIPYSDHSQAPRNAYESSMAKQAIGVYATSHLNRADTFSYVLEYNQRSLVSTRLADIMGCNKLTSGMNPVVAIACYGGYNQEDSIILCKSAVDAGLFTTTAYKTIVDQEVKHSNYVSEKIELPSEDIRKKHLNYAMLDSNGIIKKGSYVEKGDVIIGKVVVRAPKNEDAVHYDASTSIKKNEGGFVDRIVNTTTSDGYRIIKVVIRVRKVPEVGDKLASNNGQKGVIGLIMAREDMPFTPSGIIPDIIINPNSQPSQYGLRV